MANESEQLLAAEEAVQALLTELGVLQMQVRGYESAKLSLDEVRVALVGMTERMSNLAAQMESTTVSLGKIGTPEILSRVDDTKLALTVSSETQTRDVRAGVEAATKTLAEAIRLAGDTSEEARQVQQVEMTRQIGKVRLLVVVSAVLAGLSLLATLVWPR